MSKKVDAALYWSVQHKKNELISENEELKRELKSFKLIKKYIDPKDHILINGIEYHVDLSDGNFYTKESFQDIYGPESSKLWDKSALILHTIVNELNKHL